jgi:hypothetical protein
MGYLLSQPTIDVDAVGDDGNAPLHIAVSRNNVTAIRQLTAHGAKPNVLNTSLETPLILAAKARNSQMVEELLFDGADINARDGLGHTALYYLMHGPAGVPNYPGMPQIHVAGSIRPLTIPGAMGLQGAVDSMQPIIQMMKKKGAKDI